MKYYKSQESELLYYQKQSECYQILINSFNEIIETVKKFDGKVLNIRFEKALKELFINSDVNIYESKNQIKIIYHTGYKDPADKDGWCYLEYDGIWANIILNQENRIQAIETILDIQDTIKRLTESKKELDYTIENYDNLKKEYEDICNKIREFDKKYNYIVRQNYKFDRV